jgi:hypothetical protein
MALKNQPFKKIFGVLKAVAPTFLAGAAGPFGPLLSGVAKQVMGDEAMSDDQLEEAVASASGTTDGLARIREIESRSREVEAGLKVRFVELAIRQQEIDAGDRTSARAMGVAKGLLPQIVLSVAYTVGYFWVLWLFLTGRVVVQTDQLIMVTTLVGVLTAVQVQILNFWFGSSSGSKEKTASLVATNGSK